MARESPEDYCIVPDYDPRRPDLAPLERLIPEVFSLITSKFEPLGAADWHSLSALSRASRTLRARLLPLVFEHFPLWFAETCFLALEKVSQHPQMYVVLGTQRAWLTTSLVLSAFTRWRYPHLSWEWSLD